jgi:Holliday junction resolvase RusA-like endonuclease
MIQVIKGLIPSKSNCYRFNPGGNMYKSKGLISYENTFYLQCNRYRNKNIEGFFEIYLEVYYPSMRSDLDGALKIFLDCLQKCKAIKNDNRCTKIVASKFVDKADPRIEFVIKEV